MTNSNFVTIKIYSVCFELKSTILIFVFLSFFSVFSSAQDTSLKVQYGFNNKSTTDSIVDILAYKCDTTEIIQWL